MLLPKTRFPAIELLSIPKHEAYPNGDEFLAWHILQKKKRHSISNCEGGVKSRSLFSNQYFDPHFLVEILTVKNRPSWKLKFDPFSKILFTCVSSKNKRMHDRRFYLVSFWLSNNISSACSGFYNIQAKVMILERRELKLTLYTISIS